MLLIKINFQYVNNFSLKHYVDINPLPHFIYIQNTNKLITTKYDKHPD